MKIIVSIAFILFVCCSSCRDNTNRIPLVSVNLSINTDLPEFQPLIVPTGHVYITGGSRGIVVYRVSTNEFKAYDRHSTYEVNNGCRVFVQEDNFTLKDECSESRWSIGDGSLISGPATTSLKEYDTIWNPPVLTITN